LYLFSESDRLNLSAARQPNFSNAFLKLLAGWLTVQQSGSYGLPGGLTPEDIFHYIYAVLHSPSYRSRYVEFLKVDFPRVPLTANLELFRALGRVGSQLVALHLLESPKLAQAITKFSSDQNPEVEKISWARNTVWIDKGQTMGFHGVSEAVWNFHIGGYQVCEKWLKDRKGRTLSKGDIGQYQKIIVVLDETIRLMKEIDKLIDGYGGWPAAFAHVAEHETTPASGIATIDNVVTVRSDRTAEELVFNSSGTASMLKAAEPDIAEYESGVTAKGGAAGPSERRLVADGEELICLVRQTFADGAERDRKSAIVELARTLGYQLGTRIDEELDNTLRTAVRRGILEGGNGMLKLAVGSIEHYDRVHLKDQFLASLSGHRWVDRDDAIRAFARWRGFRRTGSSIDDTARSLINGLIREGRIESDGGMIRRSG
jgi:hypothetical protein